VFSFSFFAWLDNAMDIDNEQIGGMPNPTESCAQNTRRGDQAKDLKNRSFMISNDTIT
jgi:hypothetical protein